MAVGSLGARQGQLVRTGSGQKRLGTSRMDLSDLVVAEGMISNLKATSKKQALNVLATKAATVFDLDEAAVLDLLLERERLGTTGVGNGVAIPHAKVPGLKAPRGIFARLDQAVDFDAIDDQPVDLIFLLLAPEGAGADHLKALARVSRMFRNAALCEKLRGSHDKTALFALLSEPVEPNAAA